MKKQTWYHNLGFYNNPFSMKPAAFHDELFGYIDTVEDINKKISSGEVSFIEGEYGSGKTTVLKKIINRFGGEKKLIYYSRNQSGESVNFDKLLYSRNLFSRLFRIKSKDMILLMDEAQDLDKRDIEKIEDYHSKGYFKSVVFVSDKLKSARFNEELKKLVQGNIFKLGRISKADAVELVRKRIGKLSLLSDDMIKKIHKKDPNPRALLKNCEDICKYAVSKGAKKVNDKHLKKIL